MLAKRGIMWESEEHLHFADDVFERINRHAIEASCQLAEERGAYEKFEGLGLADRSILREARLHVARVA